MKYPDITDFELLSMANEDSEDAKDALFEKYQYIINIVVKKYKKMAKTLGIEYKDLYQEALLAFVDAVKRFKDDKETSLPTFITLCVERRLQVIIQKASRMKNKILADSLSLEQPYDHFKQPLMDIIGDKNANNPLKNILLEEEYMELSYQIQKTLSVSEDEVYSLMLAGLNYNEIAIILDKEPKQVDNSIQRIRSKVKKIIEKRDKKYN